MINKNTLINVQSRIASYIHKTPILTSQALNGISGAELYFKCENFQRMGAFKMRGATNAILSMEKSSMAKGVVTHSSGNMAQAVSLAARSLDIPAYIVMPENAPQVKKDAVAGYGGQITESESTIEARQKAADEIVSRTGAQFIHPSDQIEVILGQATSAMELLEEQPELDHVIVPVGGGGLLAGTALAVEHFGNNCTTIGAEPRGADDAYWSLKSGRIIKHEKVNTIADGLRTHLGEVNFPIIKQHVSEIIRVEDGDTIAAMRLIWERMKIIIEPSCAVPLGAIMLNKDKFRDKKIGIVLTGGNVDLNNLPF